MSADFEGEKFIVANDGTNYDKSSLVSKKAKKLFTPLSVVMVLLVFSDIIFAIDSERLFRTVRAGALLHGRNPEAR